MVGKIALGAHKRCLHLKSSEEKSSKILSGKSGFSGLIGAFSGPIRADWDQSLFTSEPRGEEQKLPNKVFFFAPSPSSLGLRFNFSFRFPQDGLFRRLLGASEKPFPLQNLLLKRRGGTLLEIKRLASHLLRLTPLAFGKWCFRNRASPL